MPTVTLKFNLPEEDGDHMLAIFGHNFYSSLIDIDNMCRNWQKHGCELINKEEMLQQIREAVTDRIWEIE